MIPSGTHISAETSVSGRLGGFYFKILREHMGLVQGAGNAIYEFEVA